MHVLTEQRMANFADQGKSRGMGNGGPRGERVEWCFEESDGADDLGERSLVRRPHLLMCRN